MLSSLSLRDERSVSARLESLELLVRRMQDTFVTRQQPSGRGTLSTGQGGSGRGRSGFSSLPRVLITEETPRNIFASVTAGGDLGVLRPISQQRSDQYF
jgi:hypothetical protein